MRIGLDTFTCSSIELGFGRSRSAGMQAAIRHYTRRLQSQRKPLPVPVFLLGRDALGEQVEFDLSVEPDVEAALEAEARRQDVALDLLLAHVVLVYLADLDATSQVRNGASEEIDGSSRCAVGAPISKQAIGPARGGRPDRPPHLAAARRDGRDAFRGGGGIRKR